MSGEKEKRGGKAPKVKMLKCYKCAEPVSAEDTRCPHCGATGSFNPAWVYRVILGFIVGFMLWLIFWA